MEDDTEVQDNNWIHYHDGTDIHNIKKMTIVCSRMIHIPSLNQMVGSQIMYIRVTFLYIMILSKHMGNHRGCTDECTDYMSARCLSRTEMMYMSRMQGVLPWNIYGYD
eukprot:1073084_1